mgnify:CR=1 FL=1
MTFIKVIVKIEFTSFFIELLGKKKIEIDVDPETTVENLMEILQNKYRGIPFRNSMLTIDYKPLDQNHIVNGEENLKIIPHVQCP